MTDCWLQTHSGGRIDLLEPRVEQIKVDDIAHGLSNLCRFAGQCNTFYSVAEHSVRVCELIEKHTGNPYTAMAALFHDASEAYLVDIPAPLKAVLPQYKEIEDNMQRVIFESLGISGNRGAQHIKHFDLVMLATEKKHLLKPYFEPWHVLKGISPVSDQMMKPLSPPEAEAFFQFKYEQTHKRIRNAEFNRPRTTSVS